MCLCLCTRSHRIIAFLTLLQSIRTYIHIVSLVYIFSVPQFEYVGTTVVCTACMHANKSKQNLASCSHCVSINRFVALHCVHFFSNKFIGNIRSKSFICIRSAMIIGIEPRFELTLSEVQSYKGQLYVVKKNIEVTNKTQDHNSYSHQASSSLPSSLSRIIVYK